MLEVWTTFVLLFQTDPDLVDKLVLTNLVFLLLLTVDKCQLYRNHLWRYDIRYIVLQNYLKDSCDVRTVGSTFHL
jgi:hypothetical protein